MWWNWRANRVSYKVRAEKIVENSSILEENLLLPFEHKLSYYTCECNCPVHCMFLRSQSYIIPFQAKHGQLTDSAFLMHVNAVSVSLKLLFLLFRVYLDIMPRIFVGLYVQTLQSWYVCTNLYGVILSSLEFSLNRCTNFRDSILLCFLRNRTLFLKHSLSTSCGNE